MTTNDFNTPPGAGNSGAVLDKPSLEDIPDAPDEQEEQEEVTVIPPAQPDLATAQRCQACGWPLADDNVVKIEGEDKDNFVSSVLSGGRFKRTYSRYGGKMKITMRSRTVAESTAIMKALDYASKEEGVDNMPELMTRTLYYQMVVGLAGLDMGDEGETFPELTTAQLENLDETSKELTKDWNEAKYSTIQNAAGMFDRLVHQLTLRAHDSDFWKGEDTPD